MFTPIVTASCVLAAGACLSTGCSKPPPRTTANVKVGSLDPAGDWSGVFYSQIFGHLHLVKEGNSVSGKWRTSSGDKWGQLNGEATGDLLKYKWVEHKIGSIGPSATTEGRGYFQYVVPPGENTNHEIHGEWGLGRVEIGNPWVALRQRGMLPNLSSIGPDETERVDLADEWDAPATTPTSPGDEQ